MSTKNFRRLNGKNTIIKDFYEDKNIAESGGKKYKKPNEIITDNEKE